MATAQTMRRVLAAVAAAVAMAACAAPAAARYVVLHAAGPSAARFPPGTALPDGAAVRLGPEDRLVLLGQTGTRVLNGPGNFRPGRPPAPRSRAVAEASVRRAAAAHRIELPGPQSLWDLNLQALAPGEAAGKTVIFCALDPERIGVFGWMYRRAEFRPAGGGSPVELSWQSEFETAQWRPKGSEAAGHYQVAVGLERLEAPVRLRVVPLTPRPMTATAALDQLARLGCGEQLGRLRGRLLAQARYFEITEGDLGWTAVAPDVLQ